MVQFYWKTINAFKIYAVPSSPSNFRCWTNNGDEPIADGGRENRRIITAKGSLEMDQFTFHEMTLTWLDGGLSYLDGGTMFGPVPKVLWSRKYNVNENNLIELTAHPILIRYQNK